MGSSERRVIVLCFGSFLSGGVGNANADADADAEAEWGEAGEELDYS